MAIRATWRVTRSPERSPLSGLCSWMRRWLLTSLFTRFTPSHRRGKRARCSVPRNRGPNTTLLASMTTEGMGACLAVEGATTGAVLILH